ncbi:DUF2490 domain-containing protein [Hymenobacter sp. HMF4947]|uniref:DUF2490 domain-containing protein n=1 Tax=Hymenobacter ginkgonis TaxID=2682976 RepID=A0A7K1TG30_9BACT|nr:DUF2490 domain-containing protein [Hymenobacter ginkgonis]MVN77357.1 DUF2490 domain-containing protein [Hymenobacter ginkgonis]
MRISTIAGLLVLLTAGSAQAQTPLNPVQPWGSWLVGTVQLPGSASNKWGGFAEVQARTNGVFHDYFYNELKAGGSFDIDPNFTVTVAGGRYSTSDYQDLGAGPLNVEKRLWEQFTLTQYSHRLKLEHRYRIEQRWLAFRDGATEFRQRFRYRLNGFLPLNAKTIAPGTAFLSAYDEIFLNPKGPVFERNRVYLGVGYQFNPHIIVQAGYVNQANYNYQTTQGQFILQNTAAKNNVVLNFTYKLSHRSAANTPTESLPSQPD